MVQKSTKKQYITPTLKEHGVVRELTQTGSGGRQDHDMGMSMGMGMSWWKWW
jgi:hypothetical protein